MNWSRIPSLAALRAFEATARGQSFSKAARELNVTHAAIAQHVRSLEAEFGEALVVRQGRGLILSPEGQRLADALSAGFETDLPPKAPSFITRVCGFGFHSRWYRFGQARCLQSPQIAQVPDVLLRVFGFQAMSVV